MKVNPTMLTKGVVLLLGSDSGLWQGVRAALEAENYAVHSAANHDEIHGFTDLEAIDIVVIEADHEPESLGRLLAQLKARRPQLRTIGIREFQIRAARANLAGVNVWIERPLSQTRLVAAANRLLAEVRSEAFRQELLRRQAIPFFSPVLHRHWGLNE